jgi:hypothetical protein
LASASDQKSFAILFDGHLLQRFEILFDLVPFEVMAVCFQTTIEFFTKNQSQKTAEHVAPDCIVALVEDGPRFQQ